MIDKKELISTYLQQFGSHYQISRLLNPTLRIDDEFISHFFEQVVDQYGETFAITEEEKTEIERKIKSQYCIFQDEGAALVGDYEHDFMWYANLQAQEDYDEYYWPRYKAHLENKNFSPAGIDTLENKTLPKLMSYIGNPNEDSPFSIRGLVVGDVQSGKTSNYLGLITKAADAGYKVIFLLTGTIESLRRQTQKRVEEGFIGYDSVNAEDVGVGRGSRTPKAFTSRNNDFTGKNDQNTTYKINDNASEPMIFVIKKNVSVLKKLYASLKNINTSSAVSQITVPMIMIDDEADNASINTNKKDEDPTKINNYIRKILTLFARNTYVGFTATPFANVFISYDTQDEMLADDLFPRHFIYSLESPSNYCGAQKYFFESNSNVRFINDYDDKVFPLRHKKEWDGDKLFPSFYHSINVFLLANAIRDIREVEKNTHRSMLINMSRFTDVQFVIKEIVENYFADMKRAIKQNCRCKKEDYMRNSLISALYESYELEYADNNWFGKTATWDQVFERLPEAIKDIEIAVVNSSRNSNKLDYSKHERDGLRVIAIGGLALSRGLTLEGLCVSYFYRNTATFDVLMQMGRWFGYRDDYGDMCKIYLTDFSYRYYREISQSIDQLKKDIRTMGAQGKRPEDYGIRVRNNSSEMGITAANKMRNTKAKIDRKSFYGSVFETPYLHRSLSAVSENIDHTSAFLRELTVAQKDDSVQHPYIRDISARRVFELLQVLNIHEANENFDTTIDTVNNNVIVEDDGKGMTAGDINESFLNIGYDKRSDNGVTDSGRKIMGRKGIGKLATFSLTNTVRVLSSKDHKKAGCILDFKRITEDDAEPDAINPDVIIFDEKRLSKNGTGTRLELIGVKKKITVSFRFIVSKLMRTFDVNDLNFSIHIRKNNEKYRTLIRSELDYFSIMDTIITIGENFASKLESVNNNSIPERYKLTSTYDEYIAAQPVRGRNLLSAFPYKIEVEDKDGNAANIDFAISGWMGTVRNLTDLRLLEKETDDAEDEDRITINDNRISLYSRGKLGEYDILSKIKNNRNSEAYVIGELYVDIFEQDGLADMAISNRRGYEENDPRYIEVIKIAKRLLGYIVGQKDIVSKRRKEDDQRIEDEKIKKKFWENPQTREILELRLNDAEKQVVQEENLQFTRAVNNGKQTKKIFISHKEEHKLYGQFIVDVLETYGVDVVSTIIFTGDRRLGVPQGKDIYDYLKDCFREDLMVIFLFSKAFYDSNICISEAGAAWATNQNCMNVVIDISFSDIEKPSNNALSSIKFQQIRTPDQTITVTEFFKTIIEEGLHFEYDESKLQKALNYVLKTDKYSDQKIDFPATFLPKRKFLPVPRCPKCHNIMLLTEENGRLKYVCSNVSCDECYEAVIN